jgi:hypothetical protein
MTVASSLSDEEQEIFRWPFNYTAEEWCAIERALPPKGHEMWRCTWANSRSHLLFAAKEFQWQRSRRTKQKSMELKRRELSKRLARLCGEAERVLAELRIHDYEGNEDLSEFCTHQQLTYTGPLTVLRRLRRFGERNSERDESMEVLRAAVPPECFAALTKNRTASVWYQSCVLEVWTCLGGELKRSENSGVVDGPLWRFFEAVAKPVMGRKMPARSGFPDIVKREKLRRLALRAGGHGELSDFTATCPAAFSPRQRHSRFGVSVHLVPGSSSRTQGDADARKNLETERSGARAQAPAVVNLCRHGEGHVS